MPPLKLDQFGGMLPAWDDRLLPTGQATKSTNGYLFSGGLRGWRQPKLLRPLTNPAAQYAFRVPTQSQATASANIVFLQNPNSGDTVQVGEETYTFVNTLVNPYDVLRGGTATISAQNLFDAITLSGTFGTSSDPNAGVLYGTGTVQQPDIDTTGLCTLGSHDFGNGSGAIPWIYLQAFTSGAAYNSTLVGATGNNVIVVASPVAGPASLANTLTAFQGGTNITQDGTIQGASYWLEFLDPDTNVIRSPVVNDKFQRYYFASPSVPPQYNTYQRISSGLPPWLLGVPGPGCPPGVIATGGGGDSTLGNATINPAFDPAVTTGAVTPASTPGANILLLLAITPPGDMTIGDVSFIPSAANATAKFKAVVYADNAGAPGALLDTGVETLGVQAGVQATSTFLIPPPLNGSVKYWIGIICDSAVTIQEINNTSSPGTSLVGSTYSNGPPNPAPAMNPGQPNYQLWADVSTSGVLEARAYTYTWVTQYGEEGPPAPPTTVTAWSNSTWTISLFTPPPDDMGVTRNITLVNIYRTVSAASGSTVYFFVAQLPIATVSYADNINDQIVANNAILPSSLWTAPPVGLQGITHMPNGIAVGFRANEIWFSEPYRPHAWPANYVITVEFPIVGIGVAGQTAVICTSSTPYVVTGVAPGSMSLMKVPLAAPCIHRGSIISSESGVFYASPIGLMIVEQFGKGVNSTELWITREKWQQLTPQKNVRAIVLQSSYFAYGSVVNGDNSVAQQGYTVELAQDNASFTIWPQPGGHRLGFNQLTGPNATDVINLMVDPWTGIGLTVQAGGVYFWDFSDPAPSILPFTWRSKKLQQTSKHNFAVMRIFFDVPAGAPAQSLTRNMAPTNDPSWLALAAGQYLIVRVYADDQLVTTREVRSSGELLRILSGFKAETWQWEMTGVVNVSNLQAATTVKELMAV